MEKKATAIQEHLGHRPWRRTCVVRLRLFLLYLLLTHYCWRGKSTVSV